MYKWLLDGWMDGWMDGLVWYGMVWYGMVWTGRLFEEVLGVRIGNASTFCYFSHLNIYDCPSCLYKFNLRVEGPLCGIYREMTT